MKFIDFISIVQNDLDDFDSERYIELCESLKSNAKLDDFLMYWSFFLYRNPLSSNPKLEKVFNKQKTLSSKIGILSRHLIKVAKKKGVDQFLIDEYCNYKKKVRWWEKYYGDFKKRKPSDAKQYIKDGEINVKEFADFVERNTYISTRKKLNSDKFNILTFKLIRETL